MGCHKLTHNMIHTTRVDGNTGFYISISELDFELSRHTTRTHTDLRVVPKPRQWSLDSVRHTKTRITRTEVFP